MDAYKLDETIKEFESEVEKLKSINELYTKIDNSYQKILYNTELYENNNEEMLKVKKNLESALLNLNEFQNEIINLNSSIKDNMKKELEVFKLENINSKNITLKTIENLDESYGKKIGELGKENRKSYKELETLISSNLERIKSDIEILDESYGRNFMDIRKENRESYQELEKLLSSKLERIKSDIEVIIRDGNISLERIIGNQFDLKFIQFNELINKKFEQSEKKMNKILIVSGLIFVLSIISIVVNFIYR